MKKGVVFSAANITSRLIEEMTSDTYEIATVSNFKELTDALLFEKKDFLIIDRTLKDIFAKDVFAKLIDSGIDEIPPSILLTQGKYNPEQDGQGYSFVIRKPFVQQEILEGINFVVIGKETKKLNKILIVDDSKTSRNMLKKILAKNGYECLEAENATEGLKKAEEFLPDLIVVDYIMPDFNGVELARKISENNQLRSIPIILITGSLNFDKIVEEGFNSGISAYFHKPFSEEEILNFFYKYFFSGKSSKILILDDSYTRRKALYSNLSVNNNMVITSETIDKTIAFLEDNDFDLILVDLILKNETGFDAISAIRNINKEIPIIVYSSLADRKNVYRVLEAGANDFLWSPIEMRELVLKVKIWLEYSSLLNFKKNFDRKSPHINETRDFMEYVHDCMNIDNINKKVSSLVYIDNIDKNKIKDVIKNNVRENDVFDFYNNKFYIFFRNTELFNAMKVCRKLKQILEGNAAFGIATTNSVKTVEELFEKAEHNILNI